MNPRLLQAGLGTRPRSFFLAETMFSTDRLERAGNLMRVCRNRNGRRSCAGRIGRLRLWHRGQQNEEGCAVVTRGLALALISRCCGVRDLRVTFHHPDASQEKRNTNGRAPGADFPLRETAAGRMTDGKQGRGFALVFRARKGVICGPRELKSEIEELERGGRLRASERLRKCRRSRFRRANRKRNSSTARKSVPWAAGCTSAGLS